jgi:hypothetical protein
MSFRIGVFIEAIARRPAAGRKTAATRTAQPQAEKPDSVTAAGRDGRDQKIDASRPKQVTGARRVHTDVVQH